MYVCMYLFIYVLILTPGHFLHCFKRKRKGERETSMGERNQMVASHTLSNQRFYPSRPGVTCAWLDRESNLPPTQVPWLGIEPVTFWLQSDSPTNWATQARAQPLILLSFPNKIKFVTCLQPADWGQFLCTCSLVLCQNSLLPPSGACTSN